MKTLSITIIVSVFAGFLLVGCADNPLSDMTSADDSSTLQEETPAKALTMVPMKGNATFAGDLTAVPPFLDCGYGQFFNRRFTGEGIYSHLGATLGIDMVSDACWVNPDFTLGVRGHATFAAANGDELWLVWGLKSPGPPPGGTVANWDFYAYAGDYPVEFTGGTGRFEGAHGFAAGGGTFDRATLIGTYWFEGVISSVGSLD